MHLPNVPHRSNSTIEIIHLQSHKATVQLTSFGFSLVCWKNYPVIRVLLCIHNIVYLFKLLVFWVRMWPQHRNIMSTITNNVIFVVRPCSFNLNQREIKGWVTLFTSLLCSPKWRLLEISWYTLAMRSIKSMQSLDVLNHAFFLKPKASFWSNLTCG